MIIRPGTTRYIEWAKDDPADSSTVYPQATVRNLETDELIATVALSSTDGRRFRGSYTIPQDRSGLGYYISEFIQVYSDSGHTTQGTQYADSHAIYQVTEYIQQVAAIHPGPGPVIDYSTIANIIEDVYKKIQKKDLEEIKKELEDKVAKIPVVDLTAISNAIDRLKNDTDFLKSLQGKSNSGFVASLQDMSKSIKKIDLTGIDRNVKDMSKDATVRTKLLKQLSQEIRIFQKMMDAMMPSVEDFMSALNAVNQKLDGVTFIMKKPE
jgi:DNA-binding Lrp family transcriptional regulator